MFEDRRHAGRALAHAVGQQLETAGAIVLALPRGGVPVAFEVAQALHLPLDVFVVRKLGVPGQEELAMGAVASGGLVAVQRDVVRAFAISQETIDAAAAREREEVARAEALYREQRPPVQVQGRTVILIDDGMATGSTMRAAARSLRPGVQRVFVAVPVAAAPTCAELRREVDALVCLETPEPFHAVGEFYRDFDQTGEDEVRALLAAAYHETAARAGEPPMAGPGAVPRW
ncbi:MAG TPA: phosphoribosyltransferase family protein [Acidobacteriaceae bacterium]|nr:phosphoribosyltransferase family protein [Acidobacteriaceae bacterium]